MFEFIGQLVIIVLVADFATGFFHWLEDTYCTTDLLYNICNDNIVHHETPNAMIAGTIWSRSVPTFIIWVASMVTIGLAINTWQTYLMLTIAALGNEIHYINHISRKNMNGVRRFLSDSGLIQSRQQHNRHHSRPYTKCYCVITSLTNEVLDITRFWRGLELLVKMVSFGKIVPQRGLASRRGE